MFLVPRSFAILAVLVASTASCGEPNILPPQGDGGVGDSSIGFDGSFGVDGRAYDGTCRSTDDCRRGTTNDIEDCTLAESPICGGALAPRECRVDSDCADAGATARCEAFTCGEMKCKLPCTSDAECDRTGWQNVACNRANGRCEAKVCSSDAECATNFACSAGRCARKRCTIDSECAGACVGGSCSSQVGVCRGPAA